jgi:urease accessory protein
VQSSSGALQRGDRLRQRIEVGARAAAHITAQGATAVHAAALDGAEETVSLRVGAGGCLEYMPEPRVLFPDAELTNTLDLDCAPDGIALISDAFTWHDPRGAGRLPRRLRATTAIRIGGGDAVAIDSMELDDFAAPRCGFAAFGGLMIVAPGRLAPALVDALNPAIAGLDGLYGAASALPGDIGVSVRLAGRDLRALRAGVALAWEWSRTALFDAPPVRSRKD